MKPIYTIILFLSFSVLGVYAQNLKLKTATHSNLNSSVAFTYKFTSPAFEKDSLSRDAFFTRIRLYKSENTQLNLGADYEMVTGAKLVAYDKVQKFGLLNFSLEHKNISIVPGKYLGRTTLYCANNPDSVWNTIQFNVTLPEYVVLDFRIDNLSVKDLNWDFAGDAIPFVGLFTRKSSAGKGYPDLRFSMYSKNENLYFKNLGDDVLSAENVAFSVAVKNGENISFSVKDFDTFSKNDEIITAHNAFVVKKGIEGHKSYTNGNVNSFKVSYKVFDKPHFYQPKLRYKLGLDTAKLLPVLIIIPANNGAYPSEKLVVDLHMGLMAEKYNYSDNKVGYEVAGQAYFASFNVPIIDILNKNTFKLRIRDKEHDLSFYENILDTILIAKGTKFNWVDFSNLKISNSASQKLNVKLDMQIPRFLEAHTYKTEIVAYTNADLNNPIKEGVKRVSDSELEIDLSTYESVPKSMHVVYNTYVIIDNEPWEVGSKRIALDLKDYVKLESLKWRISSSLFSKINDLDIEILIGDVSVYKKLNHLKIGKKEVEVTLEGLKGLYVHTEKVEIVIKNDGIELLRDKFELKDIKNGVLNKKIKKAKLVIKGDFI